MANLKFNQKSQNENIAKVYFAETTSAFDKLTPLYQSIICARMEGRTYSEIAAGVGRSEENVRMKFENALLRWRRIAMQEAGLPLPKSTVGVPDYLYYSPEWQQQHRVPHFDPFAVPELVNKVLNSE